MTKKTLVLVGLIAAIGGIHLATLRDGQEWGGDDYSLYVAHARNLAQGRPYAETGYVYNPANPIVSPRTYPPIFPLLLAPVYLFFGVNLPAMKVFVVLLFLAMLVVLAWLFHKRLPYPYVLGCLVLFALNPYVWQHKDRLLSETPFMLFAYLSLALAEKSQQETGRRRAAIWSLLAGTAAYLAFGTRTVGIVLVPSVLLSDWLRRRRLLSSFPHPAWERSLAFTAAFLAGVAIQKCLLVVEGSYLDQLVFDPALFARIALSLLRALGNFLENGYSNLARLILFACLLAPACWAYLARLRDRLTPCELFAFFNCLILVFWPAAEFDQRFLLPILPLFLLWVAEGLHRLESTSMRRLELPAGIALTLAVLLSYAGCYRRMDAGPIRNGVGSPESVALFDWVQKQTDGRDVFLFPKPRAFALFTGRRSLAHHPADGPQELKRTLRKHGVTHIVVYHSSALPAFQRSGRLVEAFLAGNPTGSDKVYENQSFCVYRIHEGRADCRPSRQSGN